MAGNDRDEEKIERTGGFKLFVDDIDVTAGVSSDQLFVSRSTIYMSDMLGNRRFIASLDSVNTFSNLEFRFPLVDMLATPAFVIQQMRVVVFFDVGAAYFKDQPFTFMQGGRLADGKASVGWGISFNFLGLPINWDFAKRFDGKDTEGGFRTSFWIGETF